LGYIHPRIQWVQGALPIGAKRAGREANYSFLSSAKAKNV